MVKLSNVTIRMVDTRDFEALSLFFRKNDVPEVRKHFHPFPQDEESAIRISRTLYLDRYYNAILQEQIIGLCMLRGWDQGFQIPSFGVMIDLDFCRRGLGRWMTEFAIAEARNLSCPAVRLSVFESNSAAMKIYLSLGFQEIEREPCKIGCLEDVRIVMARQFRQESSK